jgi:hypothetical protein
MEDVRTFAGQTITMSFWAKAASGTPKVSVRTAQLFGTGGSSPVTLNATSATTITTSWARYSFTLNIASISGKTIGAGNNLQMSVVVDDDLIGTGVGIQNNTFDIWGVQVEAGSVATPFQTATGTIQGELAACQRYYFRLNSNSSNNGRIAMGFSLSTSAGEFILQFPATMRVQPSAFEYGGTLFWFDGVGGASVGTVVFTAPTTNACGLQFSGSSGLTIYRPIGLTFNGASSYVALTAEL